MTALILWTCWNQRLSCGQAINMQCIWSVSKFQNKEDKAWIFQRRGQLWKPSYVRGGEMDRPSLGGGGTQWRGLPGRARDKAGLELHQVAARCRKGQRSATRLALHPPVHERGLRGRLNTSLTANDVRPLARHLTHCAWAHLNAFKITC